MENLSYCPPIQLLDNRFDFIVNGVATCLCVVFGVSGIFCCLCVLRKPHWHSRSLMVRLAVVLSAWDMALLIGTAGLYGCSVLVFGHKPYVGAGTYLYPIFYPWVKFTMTGSLWMVLLLTYERYLAVSRPLEQQAREPCAIKWKCLMVALGAVALNTPAAFELQLQSCVDFETGDLRPMLGQSNLRGSFYYQLLCRVVCYLLFVSPLPFVVVLFMSARILLLYRSALQWRRLSLRMLGANRENSSNTTALTMAVIVKFVVCFSLPTTVNIIEFVLKHTSSTTIYSESFYRLVDVSNLLVVFHSATNWLIFSRWRFTKSKVARRRSSFNREQTTLLKVIWKAEEAPKMGADMLVSMLTANVDLAWPLLVSYHKNEQIPLAQHDPRDRFMNLMDSPQLVNLCTLPEIKVQASRMARFLDEIVDDLVSNRDFLVIREKIRHVGQVHAARNVVLQNADWLRAKQLLVERLSSRGIAADSVVANKFVSFLIREMKAGNQVRAQSPRYYVSAQVSSAFTFERSAMDLGDNPC